MDSPDNDPSRIQRKFDEFLDKQNIEEQCSQESLEELHAAFQDAENQQMDEAQLNDALKKILKIYMNPEEMHILFNKINLKCNGFATWDEFVSYILLEFQNKDKVMQIENLESPLNGAPVMLKTRHRSSIIKMLFCPEVAPDRTSSFHRGCYISTSKDGTINYWSLDLVYQRTVQSLNRKLPKLRIPLSCYMLPPVRKVRDFAEYFEGWQTYLKVRPTTITDLIAMPDIDIVCTSSTERDLRFYDTVAKKFDLRVMISSFDCTIICMSYHFSVDINEDSYIILGDMKGTIMVLSFSSVKKGPFRQTFHQDISHHRYEAVVKGELKGLKVTEFKNVHRNWVSQVAYSGLLRAFLSCSKCTKCSLLISDPTGKKMQYKFIVPKGISCFNFCEESQLLITGGADCLVRVWNPFVTRKPNMILRGHHAAICAIIVQNAGKRLYTVSKDRFIKAWEVRTQSCIQTYDLLPSELGEHTDMSILYNDLTHQMIIASMMIAVLVCEQVIDEDATDGSTHTQPISCVLYNSLFQTIVSTGMDSRIIVWDPWLGRRLYLVTNAHSRSLFGQDFVVEITAACFDFSEQFLLTGARDGSLKMWHFNTGTCIRNMAIEDNCEITSIIWMKNRILCIGWNRHVTEFADTETGIQQKSWEICHTENVLCADVRDPQALATASYNGEMIFWRLETGQPYRKYQVSDPTRRYTITYKRELRDRQERSFTRSGKHKIGKNLSTKISGPTPSRIIKKEKTLAIQDTALGITRTISVRAILFLNSRKLAPNIGSLLVSLESGLIQVWTHHTAASFLLAFSVIHSAGDYASSLTTDPKNDYLITGHVAGYLKVWLLKNYALPNPPKVSVPLLRLEFPFMWKDRINGRAKRAVYDQPLPLLLSSMQGHIGTVSSLQYVPNARIIVSGSTDHSVRLWTLSGRYISTLGTFRPWPIILPDTPASSYFKDCRIPPDVKRIASYTTLKVLRGGSTEEKPEGKTAETDTTDVLEDEKNLLYGKRLDDSILYECNELPSRINVYEESPVPDNSLAYIPVYAHLRTRIPEDVKLPAKPEILKKQGPIRTVMIAVTKLKKSVSRLRKKKIAEDLLEEKFTTDEL